jgi:hypothetical protein
MLTGCVPVHLGVSISFAHMLQRGTTQANDLDFREMAVYPVTNG